jgi:hypothetical protein
MADRATNIKLVHILKAKLHMDDDAYRSLLTRYRVDGVAREAVSSTELCDADLQDLVDHLTRVAKRAGLWKTQRSRSRAEFGGKPRSRLMASDAQIDMLDAMWSQVTRTTEPVMRRKAFDRFIHNRFHRGGIRMVEAELVHKIVNALEAMGAERHTITEEVAHV